MRERERERGSDEEVSENFLDFCLIFIWFVYIDSEMNLGRRDSASFLLTLEKEGGVTYIVFVIFLIFLEL